MRLYFYGLIAVIRRFILRQNTGTVIRKFAERMGVVYIKITQMLAMQNVGDLFTEDDREKLSKICDQCNPIPFSKIKAQLAAEYGEDPALKFRSIDESPLGSASISQVHHAVTLDGREVAIKVRREEITRRIEHDARQIRRLIHRFGKIFGLENLMGSDYGIDFYIDWILSEVDFTTEQQNIRRYRDFADNVNGKIPGAKHIHVPTVYPELCTENIIVMEYVPSPTINQLELTAENKRRITTAVNDYIRLSFYALFHGLPLVFHGDPHGGNIYIDPNGDIGFLDMGLIFEFSSEESEFIRGLFSYSYTGQSGKLTDMILRGSSFTGFDRARLEEEITSEVKSFREIPVTQYFVEMIGVFTKYNIAPPAALFKTAKAFIALFGIGVIVDNQVATKDLLLEQATEFYLRRTADDFRAVVYGGLKLLPNLALSAAKLGPKEGFYHQLSELGHLNQSVITALEHLQEVAAAIGK